LVQTPRPLSLQLKSSPPDIDPKLMA
jgi:hypothetical protein